MRRRYKRRTGIGTIIILVIFICGTVAYGRVNLEENREKASIRISDLEALIKEQEERATDIRNLSAYVQTKRYIEDMAREKLGLVYPDEIILKRE